MHMHIYIHTHDCMLSLGSNAVGQVFYSVCMHMYIHIFAHIHIYTSVIFMCIYTYIYTYVHTYMNIVELGVYSYSHT